MGGMPRQFHIPHWAKISSIHGNAKVKVRDARWYDKSLLRLAHRGKRNSSDQWNKLCHNVAVRQRHSKS